MSHVYAPRTTSEREGDDRDRPTPRRAEEKQTDAAHVTTIEDYTASLAAPEVQLKRLDDALVSVRRAVVPGWGDEVQRRAKDPEREEDAGAVRALAVRGTRGGGGALPHLGRIQAAFGEHDVSGVAAHVGGDAAAACEGMGAVAYASGEAVAFREAPTLHTAAHEAAHVVQQRAGVALKGGVGQVGDAYERHADAVADVVVSGGDAQPLLDQMAGRGGAADGGVQQAVQRKDDEDDEDEVQEIEFTEEDEAKDRNAYEEEAHNEAVEAEEARDAEERAAAEADARANETVLAYPIAIPGSETIYVREDELGAACNALISEVKDDATKTLTIQADRCVGLYNFYRDKLTTGGLNEFVASFTETLAGESLTELAPLVNAATAAVGAVSGFSGTGHAGLTALCATVSSAESAVEAAWDAMSNYRTNVIGVASGSATYLKATAAVSFTVAGAAIGAFVAPATVAGSMLTAGGAAAITSALSNVSKQVGEMAADDREEFDWEQLIATAATEGGINAVVGPIAGKLLGPVAAKIAKLPVAEKLISRTAAQLPPAVKKGLIESAVKKALTGSAARAFRGAISDAIKIYLGKEGVTTEELVDNIVRNLIAGALGGALAANGA